MSGKVKAVPGDVLIHPLALAGAALLAFNDFVLKTHWPGWVSGKLSDVAINLVLPMAIVAAWEWATYLVALVGRRSWRPASHVASHVASVVACGVSGMYFAALELWPAFIGLHLRLMRFVFPVVHHVVTADLTDLFTLVMLAPAWLVLRRRYAAWERASSGSRSA